VNNLEELADGSTLHIRWQRKGHVFCCVRQSANTIVVQETCCWPSAWTFC